MNFEEKYFNILSIVKSCCTTWSTIENFKSLENVTERN